MEVLALAGRHKCGKTPTLTVVYKLLRKDGYEPVQNFYRDLKNGDFIDVLEKEGSHRIGIVTQGDYVITANSIANHLKVLFSAGCIKAVCACSTNNPKARLQVMTYNHFFFNKTISVDLIQQNILYNSDAQIIFRAI